MENVDVEVVNVDVLVTDRSGRRIVDLAPTDFELEVDGKRTPIEYFSAPRADDPGVEPSGESAPGSGAGSGRWLIFVDQSRLEARTSNQFLDEIREFVRARAAEGDEVHIAAFADTMKILTNGTRDEATIERAFEGVAGIGGRGTLLQLERRHLEDEIRTAGQFRGATGAPQSATAEMHSDQIHRLADEEVLRQRRLISALAHWLATLDGVEGRKSLLLATPGITADPAAYLFDLLGVVERSASGRRGVRGGSLQSTDLNVYDDFEKLLRAAQDARVAVYTMAPQESPPAPNSAEFRSLGAGVSSLAPRDAAAVEAASSLATLAKATGGSSFVINTNLGKRLGAIADDAKSSYSLGFTTGPAAGIKDHALRVTVRREDLQVRSRASFRRHSLEERRTEALTAASAFDLVNPAIRLQLEPGPGVAVPGKKSQYRVPLALRIPIGELALVADPDHAGFRAGLQIRLAVTDARGNVHLGIEESVEIAIPDSDLEGARGSLWVHRSEVEVGAGESRAGALVLDAASGNWATVSSAIVVP